MQPVLVPITIVVNSILMGDSIVVKHNFGSGGLTQAKEGYQSLGALWKLLNVHLIVKWSGEVISLFTDHSRDLARHKKFKFKNLWLRETPWTK